MKLKKLVTGLFLSTALAAGVGVYASANSSSKESEKVAEVRAESWVDNPTIYFVPSDNWAKDNAAFKMNFYDGGTYKGAVNMTLDGTGAAKGLYKDRKVFSATVSSDRYTSRIQILRFNSTYSSQWNYSGTIYLSDNNASPVLMMDADTSFSNDWTTSTSGVWWNANNDFSVYKTTDQKPSSSTGRVFFYNSGTSWADNSGSYKGCAVYAWGGDASPKKWTTGTAVFSATVYHLNWMTDDNGDSYGYADIPTNCTGYKFVRTTVADEYTTSVGDFSTTQFIPDSFAYVRYGLNDKSVSSGGAHGDVAGANLMKVVIQAYSTCSSSVLNGYGAYSALNTNFYSHATAAAKSATEKSLGGNIATIQAHFDAMSYRSVHGLSTAIMINSEINNAGATIAIIAICATSLVAVAGYFLFKKKHN